MRTTPRLDDDLYRRAKAAAAEQGMSLTQLVEEAIRELLDRPVPSPLIERLRLPASNATGGLVAGLVDLQEVVAAGDLGADLRQVR
jgi:ribbon-helix-helix CopG family protein